MASHSAALIAAAINAAVQYQELERLVAFAAPVSCAASRLQSQWTTVCKCSTYLLRRLGGGLGRSSWQARLPRRTAGGYLLI
eukprot:1269340-Amphidinium_carterae.2